VIEQQSFALHNWLKLSFGSHFKSNLMLGASSEECAPARESWFLDFREQVAEEGELVEAPKAENREGSSDSMMFTPFCSFLLGILKRILQDS
jgi:hypothetical protein